MHACVCACVRVCMRACACVCACGVILSLVDDKSAATINQMLMEMDGMCVYEFML